MAEQNPVTKMEALYPYLKGHEFMRSKSGACAWCGCTEDAHRTTRSNAAEKEGAVAEPEIHDVRATREEDGRPRLTCHNPECRGATLVRHPFHSDAQWDREAGLFLEAHPPPTVGEKLGVVS